MVTHYDGGHRSATSWKHSAHQVPRRSRRERGPGAPEPCLRSGACEAGGSHLFRRRGAPPRRRPAPGPTGAAPPGRGAPPHPMPCHSRKLHRQGHIADRSRWSVLSRALDQWPCGCPEDMESRGTDSCPNGNPERPFRSENSGGPSLLTFGRSWRPPGPPRVEV